MRFFNFATCCILLSFAVSSSCSLAVQEGGGGVSNQVWEKMRFFKKIIYDEEYSGILHPFTKAAWQRFMKRKHIQEQYEIGKTFLLELDKEIRQKLRIISELYYLISMEPPFILGEDKYLPQTNFIPYSLLFFASAVATATRSAELSPELIYILENLLSAGLATAGHYLKKKRAFDWFENAKQGLTVTMVTLYALDGKIYFEYEDFLRNNVDKAILLACLFQATPIKKLDNSVPVKIKEWVLEQRTHLIQRWVDHVVSDVGTVATYRGQCSDILDIEDIEDN